MSNSEQPLTYAEVANSMPMEETMPVETTISTPLLEEASPGGITLEDSLPEYVDLTSPPLSQSSLKTIPTIVTPSTISKKRKASGKKSHPPLKRTNVDVDEWGFAIELDEVSDKYMEDKNWWVNEQSKPTEFNYVHTNTKAKKKKMIDEFMDYCKEHRIVDEYCLKSRPLEEYEQWLKHPRFAFDSMKVFKAVRTINVDAQMKDKFVKLTDNEMNKIYRTRGPKLQTLLCGHHGWSEKYYWMFLKNVIKIVNMRNGKKNCLLLQGASNCGKTQLAKSFCDAYFPNLYTMPSTDLSSSFMWGPCMDSPLILAEEVHGDLAHLDQLKCILEGTDTTIDVKYEKNAKLIGTPIFITTNNCLYKCKPSEATAFNNRCVTYYLSNQIPENSHEMVPLNKLDWDYALTKAYDNYGIGKQIELGKMNRLERNQNLSNELKIDSVEVDTIVNIAMFMYDYIINSGYEDFSKDDDECEDDDDNLTSIDVCDRFIAEFDKYVSHKKFNPYPMNNMFEMHHSNPEFKGQALIDLQRFFNWSKTFTELRQVLLSEQYIKTL